MAAVIRPEETEYTKLRSLVLLLEMSEEPGMQTVAELLDKSLSAKQKNLVKLYYGCQMTMPQIARELGVNASTVSRGLKCARKKLNLCLELLSAGAALRK